MTITIQKIYDITAPVHPGMMVYKNKEAKQPKFNCVQDFKTASCYETRIDIDVHTGTHMDAPLHMIDGGATVETIGIEQLVGPARVIDLSEMNSDRVTASDLEGCGVQAGEWLVLKTRNSLQEEFDFQFVFLAADGAEWCVKNGVRGVAIDALGVERDQAGYPTHKTLFNGGVIIVEGVRLGDVPAGEYTIVLAPLRLVGTEASPMRALLLK
jgi:arylformamidase